MILKFTTFKFCKSVHHRTVQINHQPDATIFQFIILMFIYTSTCFGRFPTHHGLQHIASFIFVRDFILHS